MFGRALASLVLACVMAGSALAEQHSAQMTVSANVIARAVATVDYEPTLVVTDADVARGYVDLAEAMTVRVRTNSRSGYLLQVAKTSGEVGTIELSFDNTRMTVAEESWVARPYSQGGDLLAMRVRVRLGSGASAGTYRLPVQVSAQPL